MTKSCWLIILPYASFYMVGAPCSKEEALAYVLGIWNVAEVE